MWVDFLDYNDWARRRISSLNPGTKRVIERARSGRSGLGCGRMAGWLGRRI